MNADAGPPAPGSEPPQRRRIGEFLVERGLVTPAELEKALVEQRLSGKRLGEILVERGSITRMGLAGALGEQWEEAGRHLRAVAPLRLADGQEAAAPVGVELTSSLASLQAAVSRLEDLAARPSPDADADAVAERGVHAGLEAALGAVGDDLATLVQPLAARLEELRGAVEERREQPDRTAEILDRLATLEESLRDTAAARDREEAEAHQPLAEQLAERLQAALDTGLSRVEERLGGPVLERLGGLEELLAQTLPTHDERLAAQLEQLTGALGQMLEQPDGTAEILERLATLEQSLRDTAAARDREEHEAHQPLAEQLSERVQAALDTGLARIEERLADPHRHGHEASAELHEVRGAIERLGGLEELLAQTLAAHDERLAARFEDLRGTVEQSRDQPYATAEILERLGGLEESLRDAASAQAHQESAEQPPLAEQLAERLQETFAPGLARVEQRLEDRDRDRHETAGLQELKAAIERLAESHAPAPALEPLGGLEELLAQSLAAHHERLAALVEDLRGAVEQKLERPDGTAEILERLERLDESLRDATVRDQELRAVLERPREELAGRIGGIEHALGEAHRRLDDLRAALDQSRTDDAILGRLDALEALVRTKSEARLAALEQGVEEAHTAELAERDARIAELTERVEQLSAQAAAAAAASARDAAGPQPGQPTSFLALVPRFESYELVALEGPLPAPGSRLDVDDEDLPFVVSRVGRSPLPADTRPCVYLEPR